MFQRPCILIIDDDEDCTRMLSAAFRLTRAEVIRQHRAVGTLSAVSELKPALVILDVTMPGLSGPSIVELLRDDEELAHTRVVLWSALTRDRLEAHMRECHADACYEKTKSPVEFVHTITRWLAEWDGIDIRKDA